MRIETLLTLVVALLCHVMVFGQYYDRGQTYPGIFPSSKYQHRINVPKGYLPWYLRKRLGENRRTPPVTRSGRYRNYKQYHPWQMPVYNGYNRGYGAF